MANAGQSSERTPATYSAAKMSGSPIAAPSELERGDVVPVAGKLFGVARALAHVERGEAEVGDCAHQTHVGHRRLHLTEPGGIQVVADDDDGNQRDDSRDHAHDEDEQRIAERAHPRPPGMSGDAAPGAGGSSCKALILSTPVAVPAADPGAIHCESHA